MANKIRGKNEGTIYKRKNGSWRAQVTLDGRRVSHSAETRGECHEWLKKTLGQIDDGMTFASTKMSFGEFTIRWLESKKSNLRKNTWSQYNHLVKEYVLPSFGNVKIRELRPEQIQSLYDDLLIQGVGTWTVLKIHNIVQSALSHATKTSLIPHNPASLTILPREPTSEMKILDENQVSQMLVAVFGSRLEALYYLAVTTGMRQSEILGLKWTDLDWIRQTLKIERQLLRPDGKGPRFSAPKTRFAKRSIALGSKTIKVLRAHYERQQGERLAAGEKWREMARAWTDIHYFIGYTNPSTQSAARLQEAAQRCWLASHPLPRLEAYRGLFDAE